MCSTTWFWCLRMYANYESVFWAYIESNKNKLAMLHLTDECFHGLYLGLLSYEEPMSEILKYVFLPPAIPYTEGSWGTIGR